MERNEDKASVQYKFKDVDVQRCKLDKTQGNVLVNLVHKSEHKIYQQEKNLKTNETHKNLGEGLVNI